MSEEKTEKPTAKKNKENRKEGQVPRTQELGAWLTMLVVGLTLPGLLGRELSALHALMFRCLAAIAEPSAERALHLVSEGLWHFAKTLVILGSAVMVIGVAGALAQGGFYLATKSMQPKLSKLDPIKGAKRIFGTQALWEGAKMLIKTSLVFGLVYASVKAMMPLLGGMVPISMVLQLVSDEVLSLIRNIAIAGLAMALADYAMVRKRMGKSTKMSKHDVKQEHKQSEGDPLVKGQIRSRQLAASRNRMMRDVPAADVVLVNPTHVAVALRYDAASGAPRVVARGAGAIALKIRETASEHRVPMVRDVPLARALYRSTQVGQEIPTELFAAVAQVLAFVITRRNQGRAAGEHRSPRSEAELPQVPVAGRRRNVSTPATAGR